MRYVIAIAVFALCACGADKDTPFEQAPMPTWSELSPPRMVAASAGPVAPLMVAARKQATDYRVVLYVGAKWCEPCERFKKALAAGELDKAFPGVQFVAFDHDRDEKRLVDALYDGRLIPRFVIPEPDGRGGKWRIEGSIKGPGGVANITPRLRRLLQRAPR